MDEKKKNNKDVSSGFLVVICCLQLESLLTEVAQQRHHLCHGICPHFVRQCPQPLCDHDSKVVRFVQLIPLHSTHVT